jgi:hypothetical protein
MKLTTILKISAVALPTFVVSILNLSADTLRLRDGRTFNGTFVGATRNELRFERENGGLVRYDLSTVDSITFGDNSAGPSSERRPYDDRPAPRDNRPYARSEADRQYPDNRADADPRPLSERDRYPSDADRDRRPVNSQGGYRDEYGRPAGVAPSAASNGDSSNGYVLPAGSVITVRMVDSVDSDATQVGTTYRASLDQPIIVNGQTVAPAGSDATVQVVRLQQGGRLSGREEVSLALANFTDGNGRVNRINTSNEDISSSSRGKQSGEVIGGGAALGAIIGAIAGGGVGAAIGAAGGAAVGAGAQVLRGQRVRVPSETRLAFTLTRDLAL